MYVRNEEKHWFKYGFEYPIHVPWRSRTTEDENKVGKSSAIDWMFESSQNSYVGT